MGSACSPSTACKDLSSAQSVALAVEQKRGMLSRSTTAYRDNFSSDAARLADDSTGWVAKVYFNGKDGRTLVAMVDEDCYVSWSAR
jgi:hypothetical protein